MDVFRGISVRFRNEAGVEIALNRFRLFDPIPGPGDDPREGERLRVETLDLAGAYRMPVGTRGRLVASVPATGGEATAFDFGAMEVLHNRPGYTIEDRFVVARIILKSVRA